MIETLPFRIILRLQSSLDTTLRLALEASDQLLSVYYRARFVDYKVSSLDLYFPTYTVSL